MKAPLDPRLAPRGPTGPAGDDSLDSTTPDRDPAAAPPAPSARALALLDDEKTTVKTEGGGGKDLFSDLLAAAPPPEPATLPAGARAPVRPPADVIDDETVERVPARRVATMAPSSRPGLFAAAAPPPVAVPPPPPPVAVAAPAVSAPPPPADDPEERSQAGAAKAITFPCGLRELLAWHKANPGRAPVEEVAVQFARCVASLHARAVALGDRLLPENFTCTADGLVEYREAPAQPPRPVVEQYLAPELFRPGAPTARSDVFATAAVVYELLVGRPLKPMYLPEVLQSGRTDTWFSDPGAAMRDAYKDLLRTALAARASRRHADAGVFAEGLFRAWRIAHNPVARLAEPEAPKPFWTKGAKVAVVVGAFLLVVLALLLFPVETLDQPQVPTVRPSLGQ